MIIIYTKNIKLQCFIIVFVFFIYPVSLIDAGIVGDTPSYVDVSNIPEAVKFLVIEKDIPLDYIHGYKIQEKHLDNEDLYLINIEYGEAQDCPSGCFYEQIVCLVSLEKSKVYDLPGPYKNYIVHLLSSQEPFIKENYECQVFIEKVIDIDVVKKQGVYVWKLEFVDPYICSWKENKFSKVMRAKVIHKGKRYFESFEGAIFVFLENQTINWDFSDLKKVIVKEEDYQEEEKI